MAYVLGFVAPLHKYPPRPKLVQTLVPLHPNKPRPIPANTLFLADIVEALVDEYCLQAKHINSLCGELKRGRDKRYKKLLFAMATELQKQRGCTRAFVRMCLHEYKDRTKGGWPKPEEIFGGKCIPVNMARFRRMSTGYTEPMVTHMEPSEYKKYYDHQAECRKILRDAYQEYIHGDAMKYFTTCPSLVEELLFRIHAKINVSKYDVARECLAHATLACDKLNDMCRGIQRRIDITTALVARVKEAAELLEILD